MSARIAAVSVVYHYNDGTSREAIRIERPQIRQAKREDIPREAGDLADDPDTMREPVRFLLDVAGDDVTPERELTLSEASIAMSEATEPRT